MNGIWGGEMNLIKRKELHGIPEWRDSTREGNNDGRSTRQQHRQAPTKSKMVSRLPRAHWLTGLKKAPWSLWRTREPPPLLRTPAAICNHNLWLVNYIPDSASYSAIDWGLELIYRQCFSVLLTHLVFGIRNKEYVISSLTQASCKITRFFCGHFFELWNWLLLVTLWLEQDRSRIVCWRNCEYNA